MYRLLILVAIAAFSSCSPKIVQIGDLNMISQRNVNPDGDYVRIKSYVAPSRKQLKRSKNETISQAVDEVVRDVPGGEFLMNVKVYAVDGKYYAVEGDVWGTDSQERLGFQVGNTVQWQAGFSKKMDRVVGLVDAEYCMVQEDESDTASKVKYEDLVRVW